MGRLCKALGVLIVLSALPPLRPRIAALIAPIGGASAQSANQGVSSATNGTIGGGLNSANPAPASEIRLLDTVIDPFRGDIDPFRGDVNPFRGDVNPFYGDISPFWGDIEPFWGDINPFRGDIEVFRSDIHPFWGDINPFRGDIDAFRGDIDAFRGDIDAFRGDIDAFRGDIDAFRGDIDAFRGDIDAFRGDIDAFRGDIDAFRGDIDAFRGDIDAFTNSFDIIDAYWRSAGPFWGGLNAYWEAASTAAAGSAAEDAAFEILGEQIQLLVDFSSLVWGNAVKADTGKSFQDGFADSLFEKYGFDLSNPNSLQNIDAADRSRFFLDWYDGLMAYSGADRVDHWMPAIKWTPALTQDLGSGGNAVVGHIDMAIGGKDKNLQHLIGQGGEAFSESSHGAAVASLIAAGHDGKGVMGLAPNTSVYSYNPFNKKGNAGWKDILHAVKVLSREGADVINLSLGHPNTVFHQQMANIFKAPNVRVFDDSTVFVLAAGNDGIEQKGKINWSPKASIDNLLIVGSVDPTNHISDFSNTPGETCLHVKKVCHEENKLKYHFLVAPGELLLVSDNNGGVTRMSGTSFSAPLVTGTVALMLERWPWLTNHASTTTKIILQSAQDLGEPGVDGTYGWGLLDVEAALSPLDFNSLEIVQYASNGASSSISAAELQSMALTPGQLDLWELSGANLVAIETIDDTHRDFHIPLSTVLYGQSGTYNGNTEQYQRHLHKRLIDWTESGGANGLMRPAGAVVKPTRGSWNLSLFANETSQFTPASGQTQEFELSFLATSNDGRTSFQFGQGAGALSFMGGSGFDHYSDYDPETGGVNPFLGLTAGGGFAGFENEIAPGLRLGAGFSTINDNHAFADTTSGEMVRALPSLADYKASAVTMNVVYAAAKSVTLNATYTHLSEDTGVLGAQGTDVFSLGAGATTKALSLGASVKPGDRLSLSVSATAGHTKSGGSADQMLTVHNDGLISTAFQATASANSLFKSDDALRLTFAQPLHVESGALTYQSVQIVDRATGQLGSLDEYWALGNGRRRLIAELQYGLPLLNGAAELSIFGRMDVGDVDITGAYDAIAGGLHFKASF